MTVSDRKKEKRDQLPGFQLTEESEVSHSIKLKMSFARLEVVQKDVSLCQVYEKGREIDRKPG